MLHFEDFIEKLAHLFEWMAVWGNSLSSGKSVGGLVSAQLGPTLCRKGMVPSSTRLHRVLFTSAIVWCEEQVQP